MSGFTVKNLEDIIAERAKAPLDQSWTARLIAAGQAKAAKKLGEEAVEAVIAAVSHDHDNLVTETADLIYHLLVVLKIANISFDEVLAELARRTAQSGLSEKAGRTS